jgi:hypothetical protein
MDQIPFKAESAVVFVKDLSQKMRTPKIGDRVAIPRHAVVFIVSNVNEAQETVDVKMAMEPDQIEQGISWGKITLLGP